MKKSEIIKGHIYSNGKGRKRKVIDIGPQYKLYDTQASEENLQYEVLIGKININGVAGVRRNMTVASFANWAKEDITQDL